MNSNMGYTGERLGSDWGRMVHSGTMTSYPQFKALSAELQIEKAYHFRWTPEVQRRGEEDLEKLWESLTPEEKADLALWLKMQAEK